MRLFRSYLMAEAAKCAKNGIRIAVIGRRDRLSPGLVRVVEHAEAVTAASRRFLLRIAVDYSARDAILRAAGGACRLYREPPRRQLANLAGRFVRSRGAVIRRGAVGRGARQP